MPPRSGREQPDVGALMYHDVIWPGHSAGGIDSSGADVYAVTGERFTAQLDAIAARVGVSPVRAAELPAADGGWLLTFDDGGDSNAQAGAALAERSWPAHFFIVTDYVGKPGFLDWDGIRALARQGHVIGSHSHTHPKLMSALSAAELREQWSRSVAILAEALGAPVTTASVPGGYYSQAVGEAAAAAGITTLFTSLPERTPGRVAGCALIGRYAIRRSTTPAQAAAAAALDWRAWTRQRAAWELRGVAKRAGGPAYQRLRRTLLARG
ncbi:MAG TPA: polysaccharide deacetylase family protein [Thermoleophilaceae bacterium]|nr:polysaccharide deacetylase family protein [Thermoleophilaceae bacterium]